MQKVVVYSKKCIIFEYRKQLSLEIKNKNIMLNIKRVLKLSLLVSIFILGGVVLFDALINGAKL